VAPEEQGRPDARQQHNCRGGRGDDGALVQQRGPEWYDRLIDLRLRLNGNRLDGSIMRVGGLSLRRYR
jgi:hypothetical protein